MPKENVLYKEKNLCIKLAATPADNIRLSSFSVKYSRDVSTSPHRCEYDGDSDEVFMFVETNKGEILAVAWCAPFDKGEFVVIGYFFVKPSAREEGIGTRLMTTLLEHCKEKYPKWKEISISARGSAWWREGRIRLLDRFGFKPTSHHAFSIKNE